MKPSEESLNDDWLVGQRDDHVRWKKIKEINESKAKMLLYTKDDDPVISEWALMKLRNYKELYDV